MPNIDYTGYGLPTGAGVLGCGNGSPDTLLQTTPSLGTEEKKQYAQYINTASWIKLL